MTPGRIYTVGELLLKPHPVCDIFPLIEGDELRDLVADIEKNGVREPVVVRGGELLDGRNRLRACDILGKVPPIEEFEGDEADIVPWILSKNLHRRHLTTSQRAAIAAELARLADGQRQVGKFADVPTQAQAAELLKVSPRSVRDAKTVLESGNQELIDKMKRGEVAVSAAAKAVRPTPEPSSTDETELDPGAIKSDEKPVPLQSGELLPELHDLLQGLAEGGWRRAALSAVRNRLESRLGRRVPEDLWTRVVGAGQRDGLWEHNGQILAGEIISGDIWLTTKGAKALATQLEKAQRPEPPTMPADLDDPAAQGHLAYEEDPDDDEDEDTDDDTDSDDDTADEDEETEGETSAPAPRGEAELLRDALQGASVGNKDGLVPMAKAREAFAYLLGVETVTDDRWTRAVRLAREASLVHVVGSSLRLVPEAAQRTARVSERPDYDGDSWGTPPEFIEDVRAVLGGIDLDPASNDAAQKVVQATRYYTKADNGLLQPWAGRVFLNPPFSFPLVAQFTEKLLNEFDAGNVTAAIVLVNNCTDAKWFQALLRRCPTCFPGGRIAFRYADGTHTQTRQGQAFFYMGPDPAKFCEVFSKHGPVVELSRRVAA